MLIVHPSSRCDVCLDTYTWATVRETPHAIPCGHIFCLPCLLSLPGSPPSCPLCRKHFLPNKAKKLHVDRPGDVDDSREIDLLQRLAISWDTPEEQRRDLLMEIDAWLSGRADETCVALRKSRGALTRHLELKALHQVNTEDVRRMEDDIKGLENTIDFERQKHEAVEGAQREAIEDLKTENAQIKEEVETLQSQVEQLQNQLRQAAQQIASAAQQVASAASPYSRSQTRNPLPPPPEPISVDRVPTFAQAVSESRYTNYSDYGTPSSSTHPVAADTESRRSGRRDREKDRDREARKAKKKERERRLHYATTDEEVLVRNRPAQGSAPSAPVDPRARPPTPPRTTTSRAQTHQGTDGRPIPTEPHSQPLDVYSLTSAYLREYAAGLAEGANIGAGTAPTSPNAPHPFNLSNSSLLISPPTTIDNPSSERRRRRGDRQERERQQQQQEQEQVPSLISSTSSSYIRSYDSANPQPHSGRLERSNSRTRDTPHRPSNSTPYPTSAPPTMHSTQVLPPPAIVQQISNPALASILSHTPAPQSRPALDHRRTTSNTPLPSMMSAPVLPGPSSGWREPTPHIPYSRPTAQDVPPSRGQPTPHFSPPSSAPVFSGTSPSRATPIAPSPPSAVPVPPSASDNIASPPAPAPLTAQPTLPVIYPAPGHRPRDSITSFGSWGTIPSYSSWQTGGSLIPGLRTFREGVNPRWEGPEEGPLNSLLQGIESLGMGMSEGGGDRQHNGQRDGQAPNGYVIDQRTPSRSSRRISEVSAVSSMRLSILQVEEDGEMRFRDSPEQMRHGLGLSTRPGSPSRPVETMVGVLPQDSSANSVPTAQGNYNVDSATRPTFTDPFYQSPPVAAHPSAGSYIYRSTTSMDVRATHSSSHSVSSSATRPHREHRSHRPILSQTSASYAPSSSRTQGNNAAVDELGYMPAHPGYQTDVEGTRNSYRRERSSQNVSSNGDRSHRDRDRRERERPREGDRNRSHRAWPGRVLPLPEESPFPVSVENTEEDDIVIQPSLSGQPQPSNSRSHHRAGDSLARRAGEIQQQASANAYTDPNSNQIAPAYYPYSTSSFALSQQNHYSQSRPPTSAPANGGSQTQTPAYNPMPQNREGVTSPGGLGSFGNALGLQLTTGPQPISAPTPMVRTQQFMRSWNREGDNA